MSTRVPVDDMSDFDRCVHRVLMKARQRNPRGVDTRTIWQRLVWHSEHGERRGETIPLARIRASLARLSREGHAKDIRHFGLRYWIATEPLSAWQR